MLLLFESYLRASPCGEVQTKENGKFCLCPENYGLNCITYNMGYISGR